MWRLSQLSQLLLSLLLNPPDLYEPADDDVVELQQHLDERITGIHFDVDFHNVWQNGQRLIALRLGYMVLHKSYLNSGRKGLRIWKYSVALEYRLPIGKLAKLYLCKACYDNPNNRHNAYNYDGTSHLYKHLARAYLINVDTGQSTVEDLLANPFTAA
jgi:hypothetical protein